ncbi:MAG TPA: peptide deformylase [bacterium]|nr:peptide deformylase [bacterium]
MLLEIKKVGDDVLRQKSSPVDKIDRDIKELIKNMNQTMIANDGIGIAAPQVNVLKRIILVRPNNKTYILINPDIKFKSKETAIDYEGCLSVPEKDVKVRRSKNIIVEFTDIDGERYNMEAKNLLARIIQHEVDHLDGKLIIDYEN